MMHKDYDGAVVFQVRYDLWAEQRLLDQLWPEPLPAAEVMEGELPAGEPCTNPGGGAGPAYSQIWSDDRD